MQLLVRLIIIFENVLELHKLLLLLAPLLLGLLRQQHVLVVFGIAAAVFLLAQLPLGRVQSKKVFDKLIACVELGSGIQVHLNFTVSVDDPTAEVPG